MRLHLRAFAAFALLAAPADAATRNFTVTSFDRIRIDGPYRVKLATGVAPFATAEGSPAALDALSLEVQGRTLIIRRKASVKTNAASPLGAVAIRAGSHELGAAWVNGSGALAIDGVKGQRFDLGVSGSGDVKVGKLSVDRLLVSVAGSASVALAGTVQTASFSLSGPSSLDAAGLTTKAGTINVDGSSTVRLRATDTVKVDGNGLAMIELAGRPACTIRPRNSAEISGCR